MKWLIIQSDGQHKGQDKYCPNWYLRECYALKHALEVCGQEVIVWGLRHDNYGDRIDFNAFDKILVIENYELSWIPNLAEFKPQKFYWMIDAHCRHHSCYYPIISQCDVVLHSTKSLIDSFRGNGKRHLWFPNGVDDRYFDRSKHPPVAKSEDMIFVGSPNANRQRCIDAMVKRGLRSYFATGADMINKIIGTKIHFNRSIGRDVNYRNFETIGLGTCLVTNYVEEMVELGFADKYNVLFYGRDADAMSVVDNALRDGSWQEIGQRGYELSRQHTYTNRVRDILLRAAS